VVDKLAKELAVRCPETKFRFVSGYPGKTVIDHEVLDFESNFLSETVHLEATLQQDS